MDTQLSKVRNAVEAYRGIDLPERMDDTAASKMIRRGQKNMRRIRLGKKPKRYTA